MTHLTEPIRSMAERFEVYRVVTDYDALHEAFIDRVEDMNVSRGEIEAAAKWPTGYASKLLSRHPKKRFGQHSLGQILQATGTALVVVVDTQRELADMKPRVMRGGAVVEARKRAALSIAPQIEETPINIEELVKNAMSARMREIGMKGNKSTKRKAAIAAKRARQRRATHAARKRWAKRG